MGSDDIRSGLPRVRGLQALRLLVFCLVALLAMPALAQPSAQDRERARGLMDLGDGKTAAGDHAAALKAYRAADDIMRVPTTGLEVGRTLEKLGQLIEARDALIRVARFPEQPGEPRPFTAAREQAKKLAAELALRIPALTVKLTGLPSGVRAELQLDGVKLSDNLWDLPIKVNAGEHHLVATAPGFLPAERRVSVKEKDTIEVGMELRPDPRARTAATPPTATPSSPGSGTRPTARRRSRALMWTGVGVGVAGITVGSITGVMSLSRAKKAKEDCEGTRCSPDAEDDIDASKTLATASNVGFGVGVIGLGVGVWQFFATREPARESAVAKTALRIEPVIGFDRVSIVGVFE